MENRMKLGNFIATTLTELIDGVQRAQEYAKEHGAKINYKNLYVNNEGNISVTYNREMPEGIATPIDFDVMLTIGQDDKEQGSIGIFAAAIGAGLKGENRDYAENATRVKFQIVAQLPTQE